MKLSLKIFFYIAYTLSDLSALLEVNYLYSIQIYSTLTSFL